MKVSKKYKTNINEVFSTLVKEFQRDYLKNTGQDIRLSQIEAGLSYEKEISKNHTMIVTVDQIEVPSLFKTLIQTNRGTVIIEYQLEELEDSNVQITYSEEYDQPGFFMRANNLLLMPFFRKKFKKRMEDSIDALINMTNNNK